MKTTMVKREEETDTRIIAEVVWNMEESSMSMKGKCREQGLLYIALVCSQLTVVEVYVYVIMYSDKAQSAIIF